LSAGKRWATRAAGGRLGRLRSAMCVELMVVSSAKRTVMEVVVGRVLWRLAVLKARKWLVLPVSAMSGSGIGMGGEGPNTESE
jgi:hypothetical protein